jgi:hypothetical protein
MFHLTENGIGCMCVLTYKDVPLGGFMGEASLLSRLVLAILLANPGERESRTISRMGKKSTASSQNL